MRGIECAIACAPSLAHRGWLSEALPIRSAHTIAGGLAGAAVLAVAAQLRLTLPGSAVPVTGQTLVLALLAGLAGPRVALTSVAMYVGAAAAGLGVLSGYRGGWTAVIGPSLGYLVGFAAAAYVIPQLLRRWGRRDWIRVWLAVEAGSLCVLGCGAAVLIGRGATIEAAWSSGVWPYLPGDVVKSATAATLLWLAARR